MRRGRGDQFGFSQVLPLTRWMMTAKSPMGCLLALALLGLFRQRLPFRRRRCGGGSWKRGGGMKRCAATSSTACSPVTVAAAAAAAAHSACCHRPHRGQHPSVRRRRAAPLPLLPMFTARLPPLPLWPPLLPPLRGPPLSPSLHFVSCPRTSGRRVGGCCGRWWRFLARFWPMIAHALCSAPSFSSRHPLFFHQVVFLCKVRALAEGGGGCGHRHGRACQDGHEGGRRIRLWHDEAVGVCARRHPGGCCV